MIGEYEKGVAECKRAIEIAPSSEPSYIHFATALYIAGRHEETIPFIEKALRLNPLNPGFSYYNAAGRAYYLVGRYEDALRMNKELLSR